MGDAIHDNKDGGEHPCGIPKSYHGEAGEVSDIWGMGYADGWWSTAGGGEKVSGQVHRPPADNGGEVSGPTPTSGGLSKGDNLKGIMQEETAVV